MPVALTALVSAPPLHSQARSPNGHLFPKDFKVPEAYLGLEHGGILNWTAPFSPSTPVFAAQLSATQSFLERMKLVPLRALADDDDEVRTAHTLVSFCSQHMPQHLCDVWCDLDRWRRRRPCIARAAELSLGQHGASGALFPAARSRSAPVVKIRHTRAARFCV